jgi:predicted amidohydrolase
MGYLRNGDHQAMNIAVVQTDPTFGNVTHNLDQAIALMGSTRADLYVLPELFASGYNFETKDEVRSFAEPFQRGPVYQALAEFATKRKTTVVYGFPERDGDEVYNSATLVSCESSVGLYRKLHLFDREKLVFAPGNLPFQVFPTAVGSVGLMICFDWYFPESMRTLALRGAHIVAHPSNLVLPHCPDSMPVRCRENRVFAATANRVGKEDRGGVSLSFIGQSQITSPRGEILVRASATSAEIHTCTIEPKEATNKRVTELNDLLEDRRPEFYE